MLVAKGQTDEAVRLLEGVVAKTPEYQDAYVTLAKIHFSAGRTAKEYGCSSGCSRGIRRTRWRWTLLKQWKDR